MRTEIKDLPHDEAMDSGAMAAVKGGFNLPSNVVPNLGLIAIAYPPGSGSGHPPPHNLGSNNDGGGGGGGGDYNDGPYGGPDLHEQD